MLKVLFQYAIILTSLLIFSSCISIDKSNRFFKVGMQKYDSYILSGNAKGIALLFKEDGNLGNVAIGRDSIEKFIASFANIKVLSQQSTTTSITFKKLVGTQKGTFAQSCIINGKDTISPKGSFTTTWVYNIKKHIWEIAKIETGS